MSSRIVVTVSCAALLSLFLAGCGGGGGGDDPVGTGALQVLNNTGQDLAGVAVYQSGGKVDEIGGGLAQGASWTFSNLPAGVYDVQAYPPGNPVSMILFYDDNVVTAGGTTNLTMTP